jgi:hypothetical protein
MRRISQRGKTGATLVFCSLHCSVLSDMRHYRRSNSLVNDALAQWFDVVIS